MVHLLLVTFIGSFVHLPAANATELSLPLPGTRISPSPAFHPPVLKGIKVHPDNPFRFDFILSPGDTTSALKAESTKLVKYFLASITTSDQDLWVNLSPYEKDRIIPESFGQTGMGRDLLAQDYMLKQITASLIYPEDETGKKFWQKVYAEAATKLGTTNLPVNTLNKVWIVPGQAVVYENAKAHTAYVVESSLKVMLDQDYLAMHMKIPHTKPSTISQTTKKILQEIVVPQLTKEINQGKNFAQLRQMYNSFILAGWYKKKIKDSIVSQVFADENKIRGTEYTNSVDVDALYRRYLQAFKKGAYNYIKVEFAPVTKQSLPRKYFFGGIKWDTAMIATTNDGIEGVKGVNDVEVQLKLNPITSAMVSPASMNKVQINNDPGYWMSYFETFFAKKYNTIEELDADFGPSLWYMLRGSPEELLGHNSNKQFKFPSVHPDDPNMFIEFGRRFRAEWERRGLAAQFGTANQYLARVTRRAVDTSSGYCQPSSICRTVGRCEIISTGSLVSPQCELH